MTSTERWAGKFGDEYTKRNLGPHEKRRDFFFKLFTDYPVKSLLEIGCGSGHNLKILSDIGIDAWGLDVNVKAADEANKNTKGLVFWGTTASLTTGMFFDCVMTCGVLIHQKPGDELAFMVGEMIRLSKKYILVMEYGDTSFKEIPYREEKEALWKGPYGELFIERGAHLVATGFLGTETGFDDITWHLLER